MNNLLHIIVPVLKERVLSVDLQCFIDLLVRFVVRTSSRLKAVDISI